jgi:hypothetical protein
MSEVRYCHKCDNAQVMPEQEGMYFVPPPCKRCGAKNFHREPRPHRHEWDRWSLTPSDVEFLKVQGIKTEDE